MRTSARYEYQQAAGLMEEVLGGAAALGGVTAVLAFLTYGLRGQNLDVRCHMLKM